MKMTRCLGMLLGLFGLAACQASTPDDHSKQKSATVRVSQFEVTLETGINPENPKGTLSARLVHPLYLRGGRFTKEDRINLDYSFSSSGVEHDKKYFVIVNWLGITQENGSVTEIGRSNPRPYRAKLHMISKEAFAKLTKPGARILLKAFGSERALPLYPLMMEAHTVVFEKLRVAKWMRGLAGSGDVTVSNSVVSHYYELTPEEVGNSIFYISRDGKYGGVCTGPKCTEKRIREVLDLCALKSKTSCGIVAVGNTHLWDGRIAVE